MTSAEADAQQAKISGVQRPATAAAAMPSPSLSSSLSVPASLSLLNSSEDSNMDSNALTSLKLKTRKIPLPTTRVVGQKIPLPTGVVGRKIPLPAGVVGQLSLKRFRKAIRLIRMAEVKVRERGIKRRESKLKIITKVILQPLPKKTRRNGSSRTKIIKADKPTSNPPDASRPSPTIQFQGGYGYVRWWSTP
jgi:hypothetical protein